jgi:5-methylcytosine-specific restriction endonuclease McrA
VSHRAGVLSKYRSRVKRGKGGKTTLEYLEVLLQDPCVYCGEFGADSIDHIVPVMRGYEVNTGWSRDHWSNFAPCHSQCNFEKGSLSLLRFLNERNQPGEHPVTGEEDIEGCRGDT